MGIVSITAQRKGLSAMRINERKIILMFVLLWTFLSAGALVAQPGKMRVLILSQVDKSLEQAFNEDEIQSRLAKNGWTYKDITCSFEYKAKVLESRTYRAIDASCKLKGSPWTVEVGNLCHQTGNSDLDHETLNLRSSDDSVEIILECDYRKSTKKPSKK